MPLSHDESVHGKATVLQKMYGEYGGKFPQARAFYMYMYAHPGKKLNFMGNEIGQLREWDEKRGQDWNLTEYPVHDAFSRFMEDLNALYLGHPALSEMDYEADGFRWLDCHQEEKCIYAFERFGGGECIIAVFNFSAREQEYGLPLGKGCKLRVLLDSNRDIYGGSGRCGNAVLEADEDGAAVRLEAYSAVYYLKV